MIARIADSEKLPTSPDNHHLQLSLVELCLARIVTASSIRTLTSQQRKAPSCSNFGTLLETVSKQFCTASSASA
jgi:hypothetical protein